MNPTLKRLVPLYVIMSLRGMLWGIFTLTLPLFVRSIGISVVDWGMLVTFLGLGMAITEVVWGSLSDRLGRKILLTASMFLVALLAPLYSLKVFVTYFVPLQFIRGVVLVMGGPSSRAYVSDITKSDLGTAMGFWWAAMSVGNMAGSILGGYIITFWSYESAFYVCALLAFIGGFLAALVLRDTGRKNRRERDEAQSEAFSSRIKTLLTTRSTLILFLLAIVRVAGGVLIGSFIPIFSTEQLGASVVEAGLVFAVYNGVSIVATPLFGRLSDKVGRKPLLVAGFCLYGLASLSYVFTKDIYQLMFLTSGVAVGFSLVASSQLAMLTETISRDVYGVAMGVFGSFEDLGVLIMPVVYGLAWGMYGPSSIFYSCALIQTLGLAISLMLKEIQTPKP